MPTPPIFDIASLSAPIPDGDAVGSDLREDMSASSLYYRIKDARSLARAAERQTEMGDDSQVPDWTPILKLAPDVLATKTKDFELTAYFLEALVRIHGFAGMRDGCQLIENFVTNFGDDIFPLPDEDGIETRVAPLTGLNGEDGNGTLIHPLRNVPITGKSSYGELGQAQYEQALELEKLDSAGRERRTSRGAVTLQEFDAAVAETPAETFAQIHDDLQAAIDAHQSMTQVLDDKYGRDSPPSSGIRKALAESLEILEKVAKTKLASLQAAEAEATADAAEPNESAAATGGNAAASVNSVQGIRNREDAFRILLQVADYFKQAEPHTPISYGIEQVVRWGRLPLPELMQELITDESSVHQMFRLVGIRPSENSDS